MIGIKVNRVAQVYNLLRYGKPSCGACRLVWGLGGKRGNGIKVYRETDRYLLINNLPEKKWESTKHFVVGFLKRHTANPTELEMFMVKKALKDLAYNEFGLNEGQYQIKQSMKHFPGHWHLHLVVPKK